ncbi:MAG: hypothetical protein K0R28_1338, partial [Paenibacillus sp.]|nr:hypothetical protein [Paenibacillus sp.]
RFGSRSDVDKIETRFGRELHRFAKQLDTELFSVRTDETYFLRTNFVIN